MSISKLKKTERKPARHTLNWLEKIETDDKKKAQEIRRAIQMWYAGKFPNIATKWEFTQELKKAFDLPQGLTTIDRLVTRFDERD